MNFPILSSLIILPTIGALFLMFSKENNTTTVKYVALFTSFVNFLISIYLWVLFDPSISIFQFVEDRIWIQNFINYKVGVDGISILFILLTTFITPLCIISVNNTIKNRLSEFLIAILIMESFMIGVFCSLDLVVFYLFFEAGLIPIPKKLAKLGVKDMVRISDGRMSGTASGTIVLHVCPEAAAGGNLNIVESGDIIKLDVYKRLIELKITDDEIKLRHDIKKNKKNVKRRGYNKIFFDSVLQADKGVDFDFLRPTK